MPLKAVSLIVGSGLGRTCVGLSWGAGESAFLSGRPEALIDVFGERIQSKNAKSIVKEFNSIANL